MGEMVSIKLGLIISGGVVAVSFLVWKVLVSIWLKPKKLERRLREQGIKGSPHKFLFGDVKELESLTMEARSKPINLSHAIVPRVIPAIHQTVERYGPMSFTWFGATPRLNIVEPELIRDILSNKFGHFSKLKDNPLTKLLADGVLTHEGEKWVKHRRIINPAFQLEKLKMMESAFYASCANLVNRWEKLVSNESCEVDVWPEFQKLSGDVISRTAFGSSYEEGQQVFQLQIEQSKLIMEVIPFLYIPGYRFLPTKKNKRIKEIDREVRTILRDMINKRENATKVGETHKDDLLGLLLDSNLKQIEKHHASKKVGMTINEVIEECKLFYIAGQEATSSLLVWTMVALSMHPEWQARAREEVLQVFGTNKPNVDELSHLKIMTMILYEVLRLYPPAVLLARYSYKEMKLGKLTLPPGVEIAIPTLLVHHDRDLWGEDVEEFNPERFAKGISNATKNQVSFFPFGWGPRICIGQNFAIIEAKIALVTILQHFSFELSPTYVHAPCTVLTLQPQHGAQIILHKL